MLAVGLDEDLRGAGVMVLAFAGTVEKSIHDATLRPRAVHAAISRRVIRQAPIASGSSIQIASAVPRVPTGWRS